METFSEIVDKELIASILLLSSGFFVFSMIFGVLYLVAGAETKTKKYVGWSAIMSLLYGLFCLLLGWSSIIKPILDSFLG